MRLMIVEDDCCSGQFCAPGIAGTTLRGGCGRRRGRGAGDGERDRLRSDDSGSECAASDDGGKPRHIRLVIGDSILNPDIGIQFATPYYFLGRTS